MYVWHSFTYNPHGTYDFVQHKSWVVRVKKSYIHFWYKTIKSIKYAVMETDLNLPDLMKLRIKPREIRRRRWITSAVCRVSFYRPIKVLYHQETGHIAIGLIFTMIKNLNLSSLLVFDVYALAFATLTGIGRLFPKVRKVRKVNNTRGPKFALLTLITSG